MKIFLMNIFYKKIPTRLIVRSSAQLFIFLGFIFTSYTSTSQNNHYNINTVVIDAGHGGRDPGALGRVVKEKDIVLNISLKLGNYIEKYFPDVKVVYTRKKDIFIPLDKRSEIANQAKADLFISIHANANVNTRIQGTETYTLGLHKTKENLEVAMKENAVMLYEDDYSTKYEGFDPNNPASYIIFNLMQGVNREKSISIAELTEFQFKNRAGRHSRGVREAGFWVLKQVSMPSILVEVGFVSNPDEEKFLNTSEGQDYLASSVFRAFRDYKDRIEKASVVLKQENNIALKRDSVSNPPPFSSTQDLQVEYCVQITSSSKPIPLNSNVFKDFQNIQERKIDGVYKYTVGSTSQYNEILDIQTELRKKITDCFIVAFYNGERISLAKAKKLQKT